MLLSIGLGLSLAYLYPKAVVTVLLGFVTLAFASWFYWKNKRFVREVQKFPGPPAYPVIGNLKEFWRADFDMLAVIGECLQKYNRAFRLFAGPKAYVIITNPEDVEILLSSTKEIDKSEDYNALHSWVGLGLLTSTGAKWHSRRKLLTPTFHFKILDDFVEVFNRHSTTMVKKMLSTKEPINAFSVVSLCTLDVICETAMGTKIDAQKHVDSDYVSSVKVACITVFERALKPWYGNDLVFNISELGRNFKRAINVMHTMTRNVIKQRKLDRLNKKEEDTKPIEDDIGIKKRSAFLDLLLEANETGRANLTDEDLQQEVDTFMFEGHDTTASGIAFGLYCLGANPDVQEKVMEEMVDIFGDSDRDATLQDLQSMQYLERVIKEILRMYPPVPMVARLLREDLKITGGNVIPAGAGVIVPMYTMGRNSKIFPDPDRFDPDRWLPELTNSRHPYSHVPFSAGPRNCIGQKFAILEMKSTLSKVVRSCILSLPVPGYVPKVLGQVILRPAKDLDVIAEPRSAPLSS